MIRARFAEIPTCPGHGVMAYDSAGDRYRCLDCPRAIHADDLVYADEIEADRLSFSMPGFSVNGASCGNVHIRVVNPASPALDQYGGEGPIVTPHEPCDKTSDHGLHVWRTPDGTNHLCPGIR